MTREKILKVAIKSICDACIFVKLVRETEFPPPTPQSPHATGEEVNLYFRANVLILFGEGLKVTINARDSQERIFFVLDFSV